MWNNQNPKPPPDYVRPWLTDEEFYKLQAYVDDERKNQLSEEEQQKKCGAFAKYEKPCPEPMEICRPKSKEPEFVCPGEKKGDRMPACSSAKPLRKPPKCPVYDEDPCANDELLGEAVLAQKAEEKKKKKSSGAYKCFHDDDDDQCY